jgi:hypothetical protein
VIRASPTWPELTGNFFDEPGLLRLSKGDIMPSDSGVLVGIVAELKLEA